MPSPAPQLRLWISALSHAVSRLERIHSVLIEAIVDMPWPTMDAHFVKSYTSFIGMLVSAKPEYLSLVLEKIVQGLTYRTYTVNGCCNIMTTSTETGMQILELGVPESSSKPLTRRVIYDRFHQLLQNLLSLVPTLPFTLQSFLVRNFPHKRLSLTAHITYIRNILRIAEYCPELADRILSTIVDRAIQIDVTCPLSTFN
jgi:RNA polymerase I-specific transcription initiation factor RRN3